MNVRHFFAAVLLVLGACSDDPQPTRDAGVDISIADDVGTADAAIDVTVEPDFGPVLDAAAAGSHGVGVTTVQLTDASRARTLDVEIWYPTTASGTGDVLDFEAEPNRTSYADLLATAPDCASRTTAASRDAAPDAGPWPVIMFSHCHACMRYSSFSIAEHLASWGYVVVAPDHEDNTLFDELAGTGAELNAAFLATRAADIRFVLDEVLAGNAMASLEVDPERIGAMGHSFGSVTTGLVAQDDGRVKAALGLAAPMENPVLPGVLIADIDVPLMFVVATEDHSIREIGNRLIRDNFANVGSGWKVEVAEAGHWSFSDISGLTDMFMPGCGEDTRQAGGGDTFMYIDIVKGKAIAAAYALAFFETTLNAEPGARRFLTEPPPWPDATVEEK